METRQAIGNYLQLQKKVDDKVAEIYSRHSSAFQCSFGCHGCCQPGLSVSPVEREVIHQHILQTPGLKEKLQTLEVANPFHDSRCRFLAAEGGCAIYEVRPLICRSHGAPIVCRDTSVANASKEFAADDDSDDDEDELVQRRDVCPLNFAGVDLEELAAVDVLNVDTVNTILAVINQTWLGDPQAALHRYQLTRDGILGE